MIMMSYVKGHIWNGATVLVGVISDIKSSFKGSSACLFITKLVLLHSDKQCTKNYNIVQIRLLKERLFSNH